MTIDDGQQRHRYLFTVSVTPLQPPFQDDVMFFKFNEFDKQLAVSKQDGEKIKAMLSNAPVGREIVLAKDGDMICVYVAQ
jgi:hypothetical protein